MKRVFLALELPESLRVAPQVRQQMLPLPGAAVSPHVILGRFKPPKPEQSYRLGRAVASGTRCCAAPFTTREMVLHGKPP